MRAGNDPSVGCRVGRGVGKARCRFAPGASLKARRILPRHEAGKAGRRLSALAGWRAKVPRNEEVFLVVAGVQTGMEDGGEHNEGSEHYVRCPSRRRCHHHSRSHPRPAAAAAAIHPRSPPRKTRVA